MEVSGEQLARFFGAVLPHLNERQRRVVVGAGAEMVGNKSAVAVASGMSRNTVIKAQAEVTAGMEPSARQRPPGAGAKPIIETQSGILEDLDELVHPETRGTPMSLLRWTSKSTAHLAGDGSVLRGHRRKEHAVVSVGEARLGGGHRGELPGGGVVGDVAAGKRGGLEGLVIIRPPASDLDDHQRVQGWCQRRDKHDRGSEPQQAMARVREQSANKPCSHCHYEGN